MGKNGLVIRLDSDIILDERKYGLMGKGFTSLIERAGKSC